MDVGLVCDTCAALNPIGAAQCLRCGSEVTALDPRRRRPTSPAPSPAPALEAQPQGSGPVAALAVEPASADPPSPEHETSPELAASPEPETAPVPEAAPAPAPSTVRCSRCGTVIKGGHQFCPSCGLRVPSPFEVDTKVRAGHQVPGRSTKYIRAMQVARAKLTLIRGDGEDGVSFMLAGEEHLAGRKDCPICFPEDPYLSPVHANFSYRGEDLVVIDLDSQNGVYLRVAEAELTAHTTFLVGEQVLSARMATTPADAPEADGTYFSCSMPRPAILEVAQHLRGGVGGAVFRLETAVASIGREGNDIDFPEDPFISGHHAEIRLDGPSLSIRDLGSRNGTFVRINQEQVLRHGDYVFMGQQLLRVEIV
ncbi:MAG: FHA domain-containing protein [Kofleriaceae bacterium]